MLNARTSAARKIEPFMRFFDEAGARIQAIAA
jgi:hypothetical protein